MMENQNEMKDGTNTVKGANNSDEIVSKIKNQKELFRNYKETTIEKPSRLITQIHVLDGCNLRCKHCYVGDRRFHPGKPLDLDEIERRVRILKEFQDRHGFKYQTMNISGGEPTIHPRIFDIVKIIRKYNIKPFLLTNGLKIDEDFAQKLKESGCTQVQISLEGLEKTNDNIRGKGVFKKALEAIDILRSLDIHVVIGISISNLNMSEIDRLWELLEGKVNRFHMREVTPIGAAKDFVGISKEDRWKLYEKIYNYSGNTKVFLEDPPFCTINPELVEKRAGCAAFICLLCVDTDGSIYPCRKAPYKMGTIDDIEAAWNNPVAIRMRNRDFEGPCGECNIVGSCGGCRAYALHNGNILGSDDRCFLVY